MATRALALIVWIALVITPRVRMHSEVYAVAACPCVEQLLNDKMKCK